LIAILAYLAASPETLSKLQKELDAAPPENVDSPFLGACIDEALRLNPAIPGGVPRTTPPEGITLDDGTVLPGGVNILFPQWAAMRNPHWFEEPETFRPERVRPTRVRSHDDADADRIVARIVAGEVGADASSVSSILARTTWVCWEEPGDHPVEDCYRGGGEEV
jgi:cytochrome P450